MIFTKILYIARCYVLFSKSGLKIMKKQSFLALKPHRSVAYGTIVLYTFSKQTGKVENFSTQQLPKNDVFLMSFFSLGNDAF